MTADVRSGARSLRRFGDRSPDNDLGNTRRWRVVFGGPSNTSYIEKFALAKDCYPPGRHGDRSPEDHVSVLVTEPSPWFISFWSANRYACLRKVWQRI
jgi:hypothetical protein